MPVLAPTVPRAFSVRLFGTESEPVSFDINQYLATKLLETDHNKQAPLRERDAAISSVIGVIVENIKTKKKVVEQVELRPKLLKRKVSHIEPVPPYTPVSKVQMCSRLVRMYPPDGTSPRFSHVHDEVFQRLIAPGPTRIDRFLRKWIAMFNDAWTPVSQLAVVAHKYDMPLPEISRLTSSVYGLCHVNHLHAWGHYFPYFELGLLDGAAVVRCSLEFFGKF